MPSVTQSYQYKYYFRQRLVFARHAGLYAVHATDAVMPTIIHV